TAIPATVRAAATVTPATTTDPATATATATATAATARPTAVTTARPATGTTTARPATGTTTAKPATGTADLPWRERAFRGRRAPVRPRYRGGRTPRSRGPIRRVRRVDRSQRLRQVHGAPPRRWSRPAHGGSGLRRPRARPRTAPDRVRLPGRDVAP